MKVKKNTEDELRYINFFGYKFLGSVLIRNLSNYELRKINNPKYY